MKKTIIAIVGQDGVGKSTIVNALSKALGWKTVHFDRPKDKEDGKNQYFSFLENLNEDMICDRFHEGEWIYAPMFRGYVGDYLEELEVKVIENFNFLYVRVKADLDTIIERTRKRGEDFVKEEDYKTLTTKFDDFMKIYNLLPYIEIDTTNSSTDEDVKKIIKASIKVNELWELARKEQGDYPCKNVRNLVF